MDSHFGLKGHLINKSSPFAVGRVTAAVYASIVTVKLHAPSNTSRTRERCNFLQGRCIM